MCMHKETYYAACKPNLYKTRNIEETFSKYSMQVIQARDGLTILQICLIQP
jgi:hypothetical protein